MIGQVLLAYDYLKKRFSTNRVLAEQVSAKEESAQISQARSVVCTEYTVKPLQNACTDLVTGMLKASLEGVYQQLEEIKSTNAKMNKETKETIELYHCETRSRLKKLERNTNS